MKKLSLIAGLACLATVGGVFGAWTFGSGQNTANDQAAIEIGVNTEVTVLGGLSVVTAASDDSFVYDQDLDADSKTKITGLDSDISVVYSYTAIEGKTASVTCSVDVVITGTNAETYKALINQTSFTATHTVGTKTFTVSKTDLVNYFTIKDSEAIETYADYKALAAAVSGLTITLNFALTLTLTDAA